MKSLFLGIVFIIIVGIGGLVYRNALEYRVQPMACPLDALVCPDGTSVSRMSLSCTFPVCPLPNISLKEINISFALPEGFVSTDTLDETSIASYEMAAAAPSSCITIRRYEIASSTTALMTIQQTAIDEVSQLPASATSYSSTILGTHRFTVITLQRFEGVISTAYYLARSNDVLRFDVTDTNVANWSDANLNISELPAHRSLEKLLTTLQG